MRGEKSGEDEKFTKKNSPGRISAGFSSLSSEQVVQGGWKFSSNSGGDW